MSVTADPLALAVATLALAIATGSVDLATCGAGRHPADRVYTNRVTGKSYCRDCRAERRAEREGRWAGHLGQRGTVGLRAPTVTARRKYGDPLPAVELARLRAQAACLGCGAVREDRPEARKNPTTRIQHRKRCPVARIREVEP